MAERIFTGDTAVISSALLEEDQINTLPVSTVTFGALGPDDKELLVSALPATPTTGQRVGLITAASPFNQWDIIEYNGTAWTDIGDISPWSLVNNEANFAFPALLTTQPGLYKVRAQFTTTDGLVKSDRIWFEAVDPFPVAATTPGGIAVERAWLKLADLFDSELGGPHLRDRTLANFDMPKMAKLLPDALYNIGATYTPVVTYTEDNFPFDVHSPLAAQSLLVESIRHLMRSYVEQPLPVGSNITYFDRRDYLSRWQTILQLEDEKLLKWIDLFKQEQLSFGSTAMLVGGYNSPAYRVPRYLRGRYPYQIRF